MWEYATFFVKCSKRLITTTKKIADRLCRPERFIDVKGVFTHLLLVTIRVRKIRPANKLNPDNNNITMLLITRHFVTLYILVYKLF
jgi:hypothetical protein